VVEINRGLDYVFDDVLEVLETRNYGGILLFIF